MTLAATQSNVSGPSQLRSTGSRTGVRTAANFVLTLGFNPKYVKVTNLTDRITAEWFSDASNVLQLLTLAAGTRTYADCGVTVADNVVTVVVATVGLETDDDVVVWEAWA